MENLKNEECKFSRDEKQKAIDYLLWINFKNRNKSVFYKLLETLTKNCFFIRKQEYNHSNWGLFLTRRIRKDYRKMKYSEIKAIAQDEDPLKHWEEIRGMVSVMDGEILRYILHAKIPLEKFIRHELAARGNDENNHWCGFEKAEDIWMK